MGTIRCIEVVDEDLAVHVHQHTFLIVFAGLLHSPQEPSFWWRDALIHGCLPVLDQVRDYHQ